MKSLLQVSWRRSKSLQRWSRIVQSWRSLSSTLQQEWAFSSSDPSVNGTALQRARSVIHALSRVDNCGARPPPQEQKVPAYISAQCCRCPPPNKGKPYYHTTYPEPPSKSMMHGIIVKLVISTNKKNIPFSFVVGDCRGVVGYRKSLGTSNSSPRFYRLQIVLNEYKSFS